MTIYPDPGYLSQDDYDKSGKNFPFLRANELTDSVQQIAVFLYNTPVRFFRIVSLAGLGEEPSESDEFVEAPLNAVDLVIEDTAGNQINTRDLPIFESHAWQDAIYYYCWRSDSVCISMLADTTDARATYEPAGAYLDARCVQCSPRTLEDVLVYAEGAYRSILRSDGSIRVRAGYNLELSTLPATSGRGEAVSDVFFAAVPGAGLGKFEGCLTSRSLRSIANQYPNENGDFFFSGDSCLVVKPIVTFSAESATVLDGLLQIDDVCHPPCTCDDFTEVYQYAKRVWSELVRRARRAEDIRDDYHQIRDIWKNLAQCAESNLLRVKAWPQRDCSVVVLAGFCNPTDEPMHDITLSLNIKDAEDSPAGGTVDCRSISRVNYSSGDSAPFPYNFEAALPDAQIKLDCVPPGHMSFVTFKFEPTELADGDVLKICLALVGDAPQGIREQEPRCYSLPIVCLEDTNCGEL